MPYKKINKFTLYTITCLVNGKTYIGVTEVYLRRISHHNKILFKNSHANKALQKDYNDYGKDNFVYDIVCSGITKIDALRLEKYYTDYIFCMNAEMCYNIHNGGSPMYMYGSNVGSSEYAIERMNAAKQDPIMKEKIRAKMKLRFDGRVFTDDEKKKLRESSYRAKSVIDINTGIIYNTISNASEALGINYRTLSNWLNVPHRNKSSLQWHH